MLTRAFTIANYDFEHGRVEPDRLTRRTHGQYVSLAERMLHIYRRGAGRTRQELHRQVQALFARQTACPPRRIGAFCKLLDDASVYDRESRRQAASLRQDVFRRAARLHPLVAHPDQQFPHGQLQVKAAIADELRTSWPEIDRRLFADVLEFERLLRFDGYDDGAAFLARYNVAQVQAVLYDALWLEVEAANDFKTILRYAKLARLMHTIQRKSACSYHLHFDGPASALRRTRRYGVAMARFLPALIACRDWRMRAAVSRKGRTLELALSAEDGLRSHLPPPAAFDSRLEQSFAESWGSGPRDGWRLERETEVLQRGQKVFLPDFALRHADGRYVLLELVGFWTPEYLRAKIETLRTFGDQRILVAVAQSLRDELPDVPHDLIVFRRTLSAEDVLAKLARHTIECSHLPR